VTGSSSGIGLSIAEDFIKEGCKVVINGRNKKKLVKICSKINSANVFGFCGDVTRSDEAKNFILQTYKNFGAIDILVCNVGSGQSVKPGFETKNEWIKMFDLNFYSVVNVLQEAIPYMAKKNGSIVCISSICGVEVIDDAPTTYSVAKAALNMLVKKLARPLGKKGIRINAVAPGNINFPGSVWNKKISKSPKLVKTMLKNDVPLGILGSPKDVSSLVLWIASDKAKFVTGSIFITDGGQVRS
jgi:NAD(P)-dependent dehydrogenase (short-subunit alcohol dehydrogenase family)